jgi:hypothetical protein
MIEQETPTLGSLRLSLPVDKKTGFTLDPRDLSIVAPKGNGVYGYQSPERIPFLEAPTQDPTGGVIYFENGVKKEDFEALTRILNIGSTKPPYSLQYAAFIQESSEPQKDGYLKQMRVVSKFGLRFLFGAISENAYENFPHQLMTMTEALWSFVESEKKNWGTYFDESPKLDGKFGGDGYYAKEELSFGLMVENAYDNVYRIWSRAWLVTK